MRGLTVVLWSVLLPVLLLLAAELGYRWYSGDVGAGRFLGVPERGFDWRQVAPYVVFHATPDSEIEIEEDLWVRLHEETGRAEGPARVVIDANGFRYDGNLSEPKREGELRIFLLGGSVTLLGMRNETTICGALERRVREHLASDRLVRCASAGIMSGISDQELAVLVHKVADLEPDVVFVLDGYNDMLARLRFEPRVGYPVGWVLVEVAHSRGTDQARQVRAAIESLPWWKLVLSRSRLATRFAPGLRLDNQITTTVTESLTGEYPRPGAEEIARHLLANWRKMHGVARGLGFRLVTILQPTRPKERDGEILAPYYDLVNAAVDEASERGEPWYSFDRLFDDAPDLFYDPVHTFDDGHERFAERMLEILVDIGAVPGSSGDRARASGGASPIEIDLARVIGDRQDDVADVRFSRDPATPSRIVQHGGRDVDGYLRLPRGARLELSLEPSLPAGIHLESDGDTRSFSVTTSASRDWGADLLGFDDEIVRLRLENPSGRPLSWMNPRVTGRQRRSPRLAGRIPTDPPPNVLLYLVDTLRADRLGIYGYPRPTTPRLDALARRATVFDNTYTTGPTTGDSVPYLLTSTRPGELVGRFERPDGSAARTIAESFHDAGYATAAFQANFWMRPELGFGRGFDVYAISKRPKHQKSFNAEELHTQALTWLSERGDRPFFLYIQTMDVHAPYLPPPRFLERFGASMEGPPSAATLAALDTEGRDEADVRIHQTMRRLLEAGHVRPERYDAAVAYADDALGALLDALQDRGLLTNTVVIVTADHGEALGDQGRYLHGLSLHEEQIRVPLLIALPGQDQPHREPRIVSLVDLAPTILDLTGIPIPAGFRGESLLSARSSGEPPFAVGHRRAREWFAREGPWKLVTDGKRSRLYHLPSDPGEVTDRSRERPVAVSYLTRLISENAPSFDVGEASGLPLDRGLTSEEEKELRENLRQLGYAE